MIPDDPELRRALDARSGVPLPEFHSSLRRSLSGGRPEANWTPAVALIAVLALTVSSVGVLVAARQLGNGGPGVASAPRVSTPTPTESAIVLPTFLNIDAPSRDVVWVIVQDERLYRSTDRGDTWERRQLPLAGGGGGAWSFSFVDGSNGWALHPGVPGTQCQAAGAEVWRTTDGAASWQLLSSMAADHDSAGDLGSRQCKEFISFVDVSTGFVTAWDDNSPPTIYRTVDGGRIWKPSTVPDPPGFKTQAGGFTLRAQQVHRFGSEYIVAAYGTQEAGGGRGYVFRSTDGGATWSYRVTLPRSEVLVTFVTATRWIQSIFMPATESTDGGKTWHVFASDYTQAAGVAPQIVFGDQSVGYATVRGSIVRTVDGGMHWSYIKTPGT